MRKAGAALCVCVLLLLAPAGAGTAAQTPTVIVPGKSLGPVRLGMSRDDVIRILGQPSPAQADVVVFPDWDVTVTFRDGAAVRVGTTSSRFRTASGAGVGMRIDDATRLVGDQALDISAANGDMNVLYRMRGIGFVFYRGVAVEVVVVAPGSPPGLAFAPAPPGAALPTTLTLVLGPAPAAPPAPPAPKPRGIPAPSRPEVALEGVTSTVDPAKGVFRVSGDIANVGSATLDGVTVAATFVKSSGDQTRRQVVLLQPLAAGASAPFSLDTPVLQTIAGSDFVVRYTVEATARDGGLTVTQGSYTVPTETYTALALAQVKVDLQFGPPATSGAPRVQVLVAIGDTGTIPRSWIHDVLVEIPFAGGLQQVHLKPGETVTLLVPAAPVAVNLCGGVAVICFPWMAPTLLGAPAVRDVALAVP
jgi:hypothetical protein